MPARLNQKLNSLVRILGQLDKRVKVNIAYLAATMGVTERTIYRYLMDLQKAGYPIYFDRAKMSYCFTDGFTLNQGTQPKLFQSLDLKSRMLESSPIGLLSFDSSGQCVEANETATTIVGGNHQQLLSKNYNDSPSWEQSGMLLMARQVMQDGTDASGDFFITTTFGRSLWLNCTMSRFIKDGMPFLMLVIQDISNRKNAEIALKENEAILRLFISHNPAYIFIKDQDSRLVQASSNFEQLVGKPIDQIIGKSVHELFPPEFAEKILADDRAVIASGEKLEIEEEFDGRVFSTIKFPFVRNGVQYIGGYVADITERKQSEKNIDRLATHFATLTQKSFDAFWIVDENANIVEVNDMASEMFGYSREELLQMNIRDIEAIEKREEIQKHLEQILSSGYDRFLTSNRTKDGRIIEVEVSCSLIPDSRSLMTFTRFIRTICNKNRDKK